MYKKIREIQEKLDEERGINTAMDKQLVIADKLYKKNKIEFEDYIDRDVPPIRADTGEFYRNYKTSRGLKSLETKLDNKEGLFSQLQKENPDKVNIIATGKGSLHAAVKKHTRGETGHLPEFMKAVKAAQDAVRNEGGESRMKAYRKAMNDGVVQGLGLKANLPFAGKQYLNLKDLRMLENVSATAIQSMVRGYLTRKWYLNYVVR